jgi:ParB family chromosome partitioning protein
VNVRRGGLGRGLGALIPASSVDVPDTGARYDELPVDAIEPNPRQPREVFDADALAELVTSVREVGVLQPVVVRETTPGRYQLIMGERRWRACREAGLPEIPAIIRDTSDDDLLRDALLENLHRQQLNPLEEAAAYQQLLAEFGATHDELADRIGRSRSQVSNTIRLLGLPPAVQRRVAAGVLSAGHARALLGLPDTQAQEELATRIVAEGLSVRATEELVATRDVPEAPRPARRRRSAPDHLAPYAQALAEKLETQVDVSMSRTKGKLVISFASPEDLARIAAALSPELAHYVPSSSVDVVGESEQEQTGDSDAGGVERPVAEDQHPDESADSGEHGGGDGGGEHESHDSGGW